MNPELLAQLLAQGQNQPRKKRGGLAGIWDRNKQIIKPVVAGTVGAFTGGLGGAVAGGLMNGLDREGKGGIGFDAGRAARGGVEGYFAGEAGRFLGGKAGIKPLLGSGSGVARGQMVAGVDPVAMADKSSMARGAAFESGVGSSTPLGVGAGISKQAAQASNASNMFQRGISGALTFAKKNPMAVGMGLQGAAGILGGQRDERMERERLREEQRRAQNLGLFAAPLYRNMGGM